MPTAPLDLLNKNEPLDCLDLSTHECRDFKVTLQAQEIVEEENEEDLIKNQELFELLEGLLSRLEAGSPEIKALDMSFCDLGYTDRGETELKCEKGRKQKELCTKDILREKGHEQKARKEQDFSKRNAQIKHIKQNIAACETQIQAVDSEMENKIQKILDQTPWYRVVQAWKSSGGCGLQMLCLKNCCLTATGKLLFFFVSI